MTKPTQNKEGHLPHYLKLPTKHKPPRVSIDYQRYKEMLDDTDLTQDQRKEFIETLWAIIVECITMGVEVLPFDDPSNTLHEDKNNKSLVSNPSDMIVFYQTPFDDKFPKARRDFNNHSDQDRSCAMAPERILESKENK